MSYATLRCPACGGLDWHRDGFRIRELEEGDLERGRVARARGGGVTPWTCARCLHRLPVWEMRHAQLNAEQQAIEG